MDTGGEEVLRECNKDIIVCSLKLHRAPVVMWLMMGRG